MEQAPTGVILFGHGSRLAGANDHLRAIAERLRTSGRYPLCEAAFLELAAPTMAEAATTLVDRGARRLVVVPYFLAAGRHVAEDIPKLVEETRRALGPEGERIPIEVTDILGNHPAILDLIAMLVEGGPRVGEATVEPRAEVTSR
jgi:sirohydrochlorin ferrochelatase